MSGKLIYHWKHGWIPLDHIAALSKAHGSEKGAARYLGKSASPSARRKPGAAFQGQGFLPGLPGQGELFGGESTGKSTHLGESAQHTARETPGSAHFRMSGTQLKELAGKGDKAAQAELDRRAARKNAAGGKAGGHREGVPFRPPASEPKAPPKKAAPKAEPFGAKEVAAANEENQHLGLPYGQTVTAKVGMIPNPDGSPRIIHDQFPAGGGKRVGSVVKNPGGPGKADHYSAYTGSAPNDKHLGDFATRFEAHHALAEATGEKPLTPLTPAEKSTNAETMFGTGSPQHLQAMEAENRQIEKSLPFGHALQSVPLPTPNGGTPGILTRHYAPDANQAAERIGAVTQHAGLFQASYKGQSVGSFTNRTSAHQALAVAHAAAQKKAAADAEKERARKARQAAASRQAADANTGPLNFQPAAPSTLDDGTYSGGKAAAKAKQVFTAGNKTVVIQSVMSKENTAALLRDISQVVDKAGTHHIPMTFMVPTGDPTFRSRRGSVVGGYVHAVVGRTVHINPKVANEHADAMGFGMGRSGDHFMPANSGVSARQWVITHEMGHVVDNVNNDTRTGAHLTPSGFDVGHMSAEGANGLAHQHRGSLSKYGNASAHEAYAEAFAQYVHGGPGSNAAADAFAERFGWPTPKTTTP